jgi:asparaginyl-tRNA synthetase
MLETTVEILGKVQLVPEGQTAEGGHELIADYFKIIGKAPGGDDAYSVKVQKVGFYGSFDQEN